MLIPITQRALLALTTTALLLTAATAQEATRKTDASRDPFINQHSANPLTVHSSTRQTPTLTPTKPTEWKPERQLDSRYQVIPSLALPPITVTGIVRSLGNRQAILQAGSTSLIVTEGQHVSDYQVQSIDERSVTFRTAGQDFRIDLAQ